MFFVFKEFVEINFFYYKFRNLKYIEEIIPL